MKKIILITVVFIGLLEVSWGQNIIILDPFGEDIVLKKNIKKGETVKFKINNVNTFKINANTNSEKLNLNFDSIVLYNQFKVIQGDSTTPNAGVIDIGSKAVSSKSLEKLREEIERLKKEQEEVAVEKDKEFINKYSEFISTYNIINQQVALEDKLLEQIKDSIFIIDTLTLKNNIEDYYSAAYSSTVEKANQEIITNLDNVIITYSELTQLYDELNKTLEKDSVYFINGELIDTLIIDRKKYFSDEMEFAKKAFAIVSDIKNRNEIIRKAQSGLVWYNRIRNAMFVAYTDDEQVNDDIVTFKPILKYFNGNIAHEFKPITIRTYGGVKVNFSSGYFLNFIGDDNYSTYSDSTGIAIGAVQSNKNLLTHSLGGMVHTYWDIKPDLDPALSAGASIDTNGNIGFFFGGSLLFLEKNRLVFTLGYSFLKIKRLNKSNLNLVDQENNRYQFVSNTNTGILYDDVYERAVFIGVTYNLSN